MRGIATSPARCRLSAAVLRLAPGGIVTFTSVPLALLPQAASIAEQQAIARARRARAKRRMRLRSEPQRMLQQDRRGERVDVAFAAARRAPHLTHRAQRRRRGVSLVHE